MDEMIATALRERAEGDDVHVERLLGAVRAGVKRQRRRRFAFGCGAAAAVVTLVGVAGAVALPGREPGAGAGAPAEVELPRPPSAGNVATAADSPEVLASDPGLFHLDLVGLSGWRWVAWSATRSFEELTAEASASGGHVNIVAARDPVWLGDWDIAAATKAAVGGQPAETAERSGSHVVRWQPRPGIWAQVQASGSPDIAISVAEKLRLDRVYRCAVPFRLAGPTVPPTVKCSTDFVLEDDGVTATAAGTVWLRQRDGDTEYQVAVGRSPSDLAVNDAIEGRSVQVIDPPADASAPPEIRYPFDGRTAYFWQFGPGPPAVLRSLVSAFTPVPGRDPNAWPGAPS
jgi:hypothetical protein